MSVYLSTEKNSEWTNIVAMGKKANTTAELEEIEKSILAGNFEQKKEWGYLITIGLVALAALTCLVTRPIAIMLGGVCMASLLFRKAIEDDETKLNNAKQQELRKISIEYKKIKIFFCKKIKKKPIYREYIESAQKLITHQPLPAFAYEMEVDPEDSPQEQPQERRLIHIVKDWEPLFVHLKQQVAQK